MRIAAIPAAAMIFVGLTVTPAFAGQHGHPTTPQGGGPKASPHTQPTTHGQELATPTTTTTTTTRAHGNPNTTSTSTTPTTTTTTTSAHGNKHTTSTTTTTTTTNPIASTISSHPQQAARIERMIPKGMTLATASNGFKNKGQFIAALHVSQNLNIPFRDLRRAMTGPNSMSLGQAIHKLRPSVDATAAESRARTQTTTDVR
jgi:hypothetical protein